MSTLIPRSDASASQEPLVKPTGSLRYIWTKGKKKSEVEQLARDRGIQLRDGPKPIWAIQATLALWELDLLTDDNLDSLDRLHPLFTITLEDIKDEYRGRHLPSPPPPLKHELIKSIILDEFDVSDAASGTTKSASPDPSIDSDLSGHTQRSDSTPPSGLSPAMTSPVAVPVGPEPPHPALALQTEASSATDAAAKVPSASVETNEFLSGVASPSSGASPREKQGKADRHQDRALSTGSPAPKSYDSMQIRPKASGGVARASSSTSSRGAAGGKEEQAINTASIKSIDSVILAPGIADAIERAARSPSLAIGGSSPKPSGDERAARSPSLALGSSSPKPSGDVSTANLHGRFSPSAPSKLSSDARSPLAGSVSPVFGGSGILPAAVSKPGTEAFWTDLQKAWDDAAGDYGKDVAAEGQKGHEMVDEQLRFLEQRKDLKAKVLRKAQREFDTIMQAMVFNVKYARGHLEALAALEHNDPGLLLTQESQHRVLKTIRKVLDKDAQA